MREELAFLKRENERQKKRAQSIGVTLSEMVNVLNNIAIFLDGASYIAKDGVHAEKVTFKAKKVEMPSEQ